MSSESPGLFTFCQITFHLTSPLLTCARPESNWMKKRILTWDQQQPGQCAGVQWPRLRRTSPVSAGKTGSPHRAPSSPPPILWSIQQTLERPSNVLRDGCCLHSAQPGAGILHFECTRSTRGTLLCSPHLSPASSRRHFRQVMEHIWVIFTPLSSHYLEKLTFFTFFVLGEEVVIELSEYKFFGCNLNWNCQKCWDFDRRSLVRDWGGGTF